MAFGTCHSAPRNPVMIPEKQETPVVEVSFVPFMLPAIKTSSASGEASGSEVSDCSGGKTKHSTGGSPDVDTEVVALSPKTLLATHRFICEICKKGFQRDQNLQLHLRGHNLPWKLPRQRFPGEAKKKVYVCPVVTCLHHDPSRALGDLTGVKKHYSRKHGEKKWKCSKCPKMYAVQCDWKAHVKTCGRRKYRCSCGVVTNRRENLTAHKMFCGFGPDKEDMSSDTSIKKPVPVTLAASPTPPPSSPGSPNCGVTEEPANLGLRLGCITPRPYNAAASIQEGSSQLGNRSEGMLQQQSFGSLPVHDKGRSVAPYVGELGVPDGVRPCSLLNHVFTAGNQQTLNSQQGASAEHVAPSIFFRGMATSHRDENPDLSLYQRCHASPTSVANAPENGRNDFTHSYSFLEDMQLLQQRQQEAAARAGTSCAGHCNMQQKVLEAAGFGDYSVNAGQQQQRIALAPTKFNGSPSSMLFSDQWTAQTAVIPTQALQMPLVSDEQCPQHPQRPIRGQATRQEQQRLESQLEPALPWLFNMAQGTTSAPYQAEGADSQELMMLGDSASAEGPYARSGLYAGLNGSAAGVVEGYDLLMGPGNWNVDSEDYQELGTITRDFLGLNSRSAAGDIGCFGAFHGACNVN